MPYAGSGRFILFDMKAEQGRKCSREVAKMPRGPLGHGHAVRSEVAMPRRQAKSRRFLGCRCFAAVLRGSRARVEPGASEKGGKLVGWPLLPAVHFDQGAL